MNRGPERFDLYPIADKRDAAAALLKLKRTQAGLLQRCRAQATGEKRKPKAGEWYLSGAVVEGYYAIRDLDTEYHIAQLVLVVRVTTEYAEEVIG